MSRRLVPLLLAALLTALAPAGALRGFVFMEDMPPWPDGTVTLHLQLGTTPFYLDGSTPNSNAIQALQAWNPSMARIQLGYVDNSTATKSRNNGLNNVFFDSTVYGSAFGNGVLAVTVSRSSGGKPIESDVIVNNARTWESYRGGLGSRPDLRRVLIHEFGHVLGLGHPDEYKQGVTAIMNSIMSGADSPRQDDRDGASSRYGRGIGNPPNPPEFSFHPNGGVFDEGKYLVLHASIDITTTLKLQWLKDDLPIAGATSSSLTFSQLRASDTGVYVLVATNEFGTTRSVYAQVTVIPATPPQITLHPTSKEVLVGSSVTLSAEATSKTALSYQWTKDGLAIPGATHTSLSIWQTQPTDEGDYRLTATNLAGTTESEPARLSITPLPLPRPTSVLNTYASVGALAHVNAHPTDQHGARFQWYRDGIAIPGAIDSSLALPNVTFADAGEYVRVATNATGSTTSETARVAISSTPPTETWKWTQAKIYSDVAWFLMRAPARIERFDLRTDSWMSPIPLTETPIAMSFDGTGSPIVAYRRSVVHVDVTTHKETQIIAGLDSDLHDLVVHGERVYIVAGELSWFNRRLGTFARSAPASLQWTTANDLIGTQIAVDTARNRILCGGSSPHSTQLVMCLLGADGSLGPIEAGPTHGVRAVGRRFWIGSDDSRIYCESGSVAGAEDLRLIGSLQAQAHSIADAGDGTVFVAESTRIAKFDAQGNLIGTFTSSRTAHLLSLDRNSIIAFGQPTRDGETIPWERLPLSAMSSHEDRARIHPGSVGFLADDIGTDRNGIVLLFSRLHGMIFRWSAEQQRFLEPVRLRGRPNHITYSPLDHRVYCAYAEGNVSVLALDAQAQERHFAFPPARVRHLRAVGDFVLIAESTSSGSTFSTYDLEGRRVELPAMAGLSGPLAWDGHRNRIYYFEYPRAVGSMEITANGTVGLKTESTLVVGGGIPAPLLLSPSGTTLVAGNGMLFTASDLEPAGRLSIGLTDAAWLGDDLYTIRQTHVGSDVVRWKSTGPAIAGVRSLSGHPSRILAYGTNRLVAITTKAGRPHFTLLDADLNIRNHFEDTPDLTKVALTNLSTRAEVGAGDKIIIAGFVVTGSGPKRILVRAVGPGLNRFGVSGTLPDPVLTLIGGGGQIASNDDWFTPDGESLKLAFREVFAFGLAETSADSALVATLPPGSYTAQVSGKGGAQGVALVEAYDLDAEAGERRLINISTRAVVGIGDKVLIPGLVVDGSVPKRLLIRAVGPELARFGVAGVLADPQLRVVAGDDAVVAANDNWGEDNTEVTAAATSAAKAFRLTAGGRDAALVVTLPPGSYTVVVSGVGDTSGVALVEVYEVP